MVVSNNNSLLLLKQNSILGFKNLVDTTTRVDLEGIMLREISQTEKNKYRMISFIYVEYKINKQTKP